MRVATPVLLMMLVSSVAGARPSDPRSVLAAASRAMGSFEPKATFESRGRIEAEGRTGQFTESVRMHDGAFVWHAQYNSFGEGEGYNGRFRWQQDRSGATHPLNGPFSKADAITLAWLKRRGFLRSPAAAVEGVKHEIIAGRPATVLTMRPRGGNSVALAFDDLSHLLVRVQRPQPVSVLTETYSDYRPVGSAQVPFAISIENAGDLQAIHIVRQ